MLRWSAKYTKMSIFDICFLLTFNQGSSKAARNVVLRTKDLFLEELHRNGFHTSPFFGCSPTVIAAFHLTMRWSSKHTSMNSSSQDPAISIVQALTS